MRKGIKFKQSKTSRFQNAVNKTRNAKKTTSICRSCKKTYVKKIGCGSCKREKYRILTELIKEDIEKRNKHQQKTNESMVYVIPSDIEKKTYTIDSIKHLNDIKELIGSDFTGVFHTKKAARDPVQYQAVIINKVQKQRNTRADALDKIGFDTGNMLIYGDVIVMGPKEKTLLDDEIEKFNKLF